MGSRRYRFLGHYPFAELGLLGGQLTHLGPAKRRPGAADVVRTAVFTDSHDRALSFDLDRRGQMRGHATYATGQSLWFAATAHAAVLLAASTPGADRTQTVSDRRRHRIPPLG